MKKKLILAALLCCLTVLAFSQYSRWSINEKAKVGEMQLLHSFQEPSGWGEPHYLYRVYDWQTGNAIYIVTTERSGASTATIAVVPLRKETN